MAQGTDNSSGNPSKILDTVSQKRKKMDGNKLLSGDLQSISAFLVIVTMGLGFEEMDCDLLCRLRFNFLSVSSRILCTLEIIHIAYYLDMFRYHP